VYDLANVAVLRGKLAVAHGELEEAERAFARARDHVADAANADAGEARVLIARGELDAARAQLEQAMRDAPTAEVALLLGELYAYSGVTDPPVDVDTFLDANAADEQAAGADVDMERSLVLADRGEAREALRLARRAYERRPSSIFTASALAWALHLRGQDAAAAPLAEASLRLGTRDALLRYRAAAVFAGAGLRERARAELETAFSVNPTFSLRHHAAACDLGAALGVSCPVIANPR
jgi:tetratricopeptide (TPR) repeat protein